MKALLIIAHGSRHPGANRYLEQLTAVVEAEVGERFSIVQCAFLQHNVPEAEQAIADMVEKGVDQVTILPFFLAEGGHVRSDIPELVRQATDRFPGIAFNVKPFLGKWPGLKDLILESL